MRWEKPAILHHHEVWESVIQGQKVFMPLSVGTSLFSQRKIQRMIEVLSELGAKKILCLICDYLSVIGRLAFGASDYTNEIKRAYGQGDDIVRLISQAVNVLDNGRKSIFRIVRWWEITEHANFRYLLRRATQRLKSDREFNRFVNEELRIHTSRTGFHDNIKPRLEREYLLNEIAMSLYVTEIMGFRIEIYPGSEIAFLERVYNANPDLIKFIVNKSTLQRQFLRFSSLPKPCAV